jgi:hypothetical protein
LIPAEPSGKLPIKECVVNKSELQNWLVEEDRQWNTLLNRIGTQRMDLPGAMGAWTFKDMVAHLNDWQGWLIARMRAAQNGESKPAPPWPAHFEDDDDINAWIYEANRTRPVQDVLRDSQQNFDALLAVIDSLGEDTRIEPVGHLVSLGGERFPAGEFFDHFRDDHEPDVRRWLADIDNQS